MFSDTDLLMARRRARRQALLWKIIAALAVSTLLVVLVSGMRDGAAVRGSNLFARAHIARMSVEGLIIEDHQRDRLMVKLRNDNKVRAVIVYINSPGGTVVGGEDLFLGLRKIAEKKPVVAVMGSTATSAAYMTAIAADRIFARDGSITGSIGVLMQTADVTGLMKKLGIKSEIVKTGPFKAQPNPFEPMSPAVRDQIRSVIGDMYDMFVGLVSQRRNLDHATTVALADGRIFTGRQALKLGLIDAIGGEDEAHAWLVAKKHIAAKMPIVDVVPNYPNSGFVERVFGAAAGAVSEGFGKALVSERLTLDGLLSVWHPDA